VSPLNFPPKNVDKITDLLRRGRYERVAETRADQVFLPTIV